ncbi:MAG: hypothetical protein EAZ76_14705 [Nostocales cyanobacterium]|nr:MAG: hypothetical protein EAZ76_14705 [Nostocales cyanobacterium]
MQFFLGCETVDTPRPKGAGILGSTSPLRLDPLRCLSKRWFSPRHLLQVGKPAQRSGFQALLSPCPEVVGLLQVLFEFKFCVV